MILQLINQMEAVIDDIDQRNRWYGWPPSAEFKKWRNMFVTAVCQDFWNKNQLQNILTKLDQELVKIKGLERGFPPDSRCPENVKIKQ